VACKSLSYWAVGANTDAGASEGAANSADPEGTDPVSANTDGHWATPAGRVTLHVGSSVQDIRLADTVTLAAGTCNEASDVAGGGSGGSGGGSGGSGGGSGGGAAGPPGPAGPAGPAGAQGPAGVPGPPGPAAKVVCRTTTTAQVLCTLIFADGTWETATRAARTAQLRLVKGGRTFAKGKAVIKAGKMRVRLKSTRKVRPGRYQLRIRVRGKTTGVKVRIRSTQARGVRL